MNPAHPLLTLAGCAALYASAAAAQDAPSFDAPFTFQQAPEGCSVSSALGNASGIAVAVGDTLEGGLWLRASGADWRFAPGKIYRIRVYAASETRRPDGPGIEARGYRDAAGWSGFSASTAFRALASAPRLVLYAGSDAMPFAEIPNPYPQYAAELGRCRAERLRADHGSGQPAASNPLPRGLLSSYVTNDDYPAAAIRAEQSGVTRFRLTISAHGQVLDCAVTASSGSALLDSTSCSLFKRRGRFVPARDAAGTETEGSFTMALHWEMPGERRILVYATR
jgi:TonB family protein